MIVCKHCLEAIESHEGYQRRVPLIHTEHYDGESEMWKCEWCEEEDLAENMVEI